MIQVFALSLALLLSFPLYGNSKTEVKGIKPSVSPKQSYEFVSAQGEPFVAKLKSSAFEGTFVVSDHQQIDLYNLKKTKSLKINEGLCRDFLAEVFGPLDKISLKPESLHINTSRLGRICTVDMRDPDKEAKYPVRRVVVGFIKAQPKALVSRKIATDKGASTEQDVSVIEFWESLR